MIEFIEQVEALAGRDDLRALVLAGAGEKAFIGGANIPEMAALDRASAEGLHHAGAPHLRLPAAIAGAGDRAHRRLCARRRARSGGVLRPAGGDDARQVRHAGGQGRHPSVVEAALIPRLIGWGRARELLMLGETIDAETALRWGLVERVVAPEALDREVEQGPRRAARGRAAGGAAAKRS